ncbi:hypothetical protein F4859DRAFT_475235 [Xylaria cf. heliscus]|nr:hypothetical protein F4859DRAFT_475235 [Xylaria cf. heliscus]
MGPISSSSTLPPPYLYKNDKGTQADAYLVSQAALGVFNLFNAFDNDLHRTKRRLVGEAVLDQSMRAFEL